MKTTKKWFWQRSKKVDKPSKTIRTGLPVEFLALVDERFKEDQKPFSIFELSNIGTYWYTTKPMPCLVWGDYNHG